MSDIMYGDTCLGWPGARGPFQMPVTRQQWLSAAWRRTAGGSTLGWAEGKSHSSDLRGDECQVLGGVPSRRGGCCCFFFWERCGSWLRPNGLNPVKDPLKDPGEGTFHSSPRAAPEVLLWCRSLRHLWTCLSLCGVSFRPSVLYRTALINCFLCFN